MNWNTKGFLEEFLPGLVSSVGKVDGAEVIVADNASTDGSMEMMAEKFPEVRTLVFEKNLGFTGGYNRAFKEICNCPEAPEYFLLINSDIEVPQGWLQPLVDWMDAHPDCGACAPKLHSWQERDMFEYAGAAGGYLDRFGYPFCRGRVLKRLEKDSGQYDSPADVLWATGACLMVRSSVYRKLGGLDERFFAHMEEIDLCWRMQLQGRKVRVIPRSAVFHLGGGTLATDSPRKIYLNHRNNLMMLFKCASPAQRLLVAVVRPFTDLLAALSYLAQGRGAAFLAVFRAWRDFLKAHPRLSLRRREIRSGVKKNPVGIYRGSILLRYLKSSITRGASSIIPARRF
mgnify:CR=1 FL=1